MSDELPIAEDFGNSENLLKFFKDRADDIESVSITPGPTVTITHMGQPYGNISGVGMIVNMTDKRRLIKREDAELLLNDGLLNRLRIRIELFGR